METAQRKQLLPETRKRLEIMLRSANAKLIIYNKECRTNPQSIFYKTLIDKMQDEISELKMQLNGTAQA